MLAMHSVFCHAESVFVQAVARLPLPPLCTQHELPALQPRTILTRHPANLHLLLPPAAAARLPHSCAKPAAPAEDVAGMLPLNKAKRAG
jgi:hypothetical protein